MSNETHQGASFQNCANQLPLQGVCHSRKAHAHARQIAAFCRATWSRTAVSQLSGFALCRLRLSRDQWAGSVDISVEMLDSLCLSLLTCKMGKRELARRAGESPEQSQ